MEIYVLMPTSLLSFIVSSILTLSLHFHSWFSKVKSFFVPLDLSWQLYYFERNHNFCWWNEGTFISLCYSQKVNAQQLTFGQLLTLISFDPFSTILLNIMIFRLALMALCIGNFTYFIHIYHINAKPRITFMMNKPTNVILWNTFV